MDRTNLNDLPDDDRERVLDLMADAIGATRDELAEILTADAADGGSITVIYF